MKQPHQKKHSTESNTDLDAITTRIDASLSQSELSPVAGVTGLDGRTRTELSSHLHDLMNSLWPVATRIELMFSEESCPPKFRDTLEHLRRCVAEAMEIAAQASALVDAPQSDRTTS